MRICSAAVIYNLLYSNLDLLTTTRPSDLNAQHPEFICHDRWWCSDAFLAYLANELLVAFLNGSATSMLAMLVCASTPVVAELVSLATVDQDATTLCS